MAKRERKTKTDLNLLLDFVIASRDLGEKRTARWTRVAAAGAAASLLLLLFMQLVLLVVVIKVRKWTVATRYERAAETTTRRLKRKFLRN